MKIKKKILEGFKRGTSFSNSTDNSIKDAYTARINKAIKAYGGDLEKVLVAAKQQRTKVGQFIGNTDEAEVQSNIENEPVIYFRFGDLIDAAVHQSRYSKSTNSKSRSENKFDKNQQFEIMLGTVDFIDPNTGKTHSIAISDIPVSLEYFNAFFINNVITNDRIEYPLRDFIKEVTSKLLPNLIRPVTNGIVGKGQRNKFGFSVFNINESFYKTLQKSPNADKALKGKSYSDISSNEAGKQKQVFLIYAKDVITTARTGNELEDNKNGIYHFFVGADRGILKRPSFYRADLPFQREKRIFDSRGGTSNLITSDTYNADLTLMGCPIFKPGMFIYLNTQGLGIGNQTDLNSKARILGIGGYYSIITVENIIESGKFETLIKTQWNSPVDPPKKYSPPSLAASLNATVTVPEKGIVIKRTLAVPGIDVVTGKTVAGPDVTTTLTTEEFDRLNGLQPGQIRQILGTPGFGSKIKSKKPKTNVQQNQDPSTLKTGRPFITPTGGDD